MWGACICYSLKGIPNGVMHVWHWRVFVMNAVRACCILPPCVPPCMAPRNALCMPRRAAIYTSRVHAVVQQSIRHVHVHVHVRVPCSMCHRASSPGGALDCVLRCQPVLRRRRARSRRAPRGQAGGRRAASAVPAAAAGGGPAGLAGGAATDERHGGPGWGVGVGVGVGAGVWG